MFIATWLRNYFLTVLPVNKFDTFEFDHLIHIFSQKTKRLWFLFPIFLTTRTTMMLYMPTSDNNIKTKWMRFKQWILKHNDNNTLQLLLNKFHRSEVLIVYSSTKPKWFPALKDLGVLLEKHGISCVVIDGKKIIQYQKETNKEMKNIEFEWDSFLDFTFNRINKLNIILWSFAACFVLVFIFLTSPKLFKLLKLIPIFFFEFVESYRRILIAKIIIEYLGSEIIITNGEHIPICSEIMLYAKTTGRHNIWYHNERLASFSIPILSTEVWTWNTIVDDALKSVMPTDSNIYTTVVGYAEADYTDNIFNDYLFLEDLNWIKQSQKPLLIFLMDYGGPSSKVSIYYASRSLEILSEVAAANLDWCFLIKPRPFQNKLPIPGEELIAPLKNCRILRSKCSLGPFLTIDETKVLAGCMSSGIFLAAAKGKVPVRLMISGVDFSIPYLDAICEKIYTADELNKFLKDLKKNYFAVKKSQDDLFPYQGAVVKRMCDVTLERLGQKKIQHCNEENFYK